MSFQDDYKDLESRLRHNKPQTESLPPALKRQMRQALMEQMTMNENRFTFRKISMALGSLILLIGIPLFFWMSQMSIGTAVVPGADGPTAEPNLLDPARPTIAVVGEEVEVPVVELATDKVWIISADTAQGETVGRYETINVTIGYELVNVTEAVVIMKLVDGPRGVLTTEKLVSGASGTAEIPLPLAGLEDVSGESISLELHLQLRELNPDAEKLLYLDFLDGWTIDLTAEPITTADIVRVSKPSVVETNRVVDESIYEVEVTASYALSGYDNGVLIIGYQYQDADGGTSGSEVIAINAGSGSEIPVRFHIDRSLFNDIGETIEGMTFFARINRYDETAAEWLNLYPGDVVLSDAERELPYPYLADSFFVQSAGWTEDTAGQTVLNVTMGYNLVSQPTADILVDVTGLGEALLSSESAKIEQGEGTLTLAVALDRTQLAANSAVQVSAVMTAGESVIQDQQSVIIDIQSPTTVPALEGEVWVISTNVVTSTTVNGVKADITLVVGFDLSGDYSGGRIDFANQYPPAGDSTGGGGGSSAQITPGNGVTEFTFGFEVPSWAVAKIMLDGMSTHLELFGYSTTGANQLVGEAFKIGID